MKRNREVPNEAPWLFELSEISDNSESEKISDGESNPYAAIPIYSSNVHKNDLKKIFEMRKIKSSMNKFFWMFDAKDVDQFLKQARFMAQFQCDYAEEVPFECHLPVYADMNVKQQKYYFFWRTNVKNGIIHKTSLSYVFVYLHELINCIGVDDAVQAFQKMASFWLCYREHDSIIDRYLHTWMKDFYICNNFSVSFKELLIQHNLQSFYPDFFLHSPKDKLYSQLYQLSDYNLEESRFIENDKNKIAFVEKCFLLIISFIDVFMELYGSSLSETVRNGSSRNARDYEPFSDAVYKPQFQKKRKIFIDDREYYQYTGDDWISNVFSFSEYNNKLPPFIGYIVKKIEAALRVTSGFKHKLSPNVDVIIQKISSGSDMFASQNNILKKVLSDSHLNTIINEIAGSCFSLSPSFDSALIDADNLNIPFCKTLLHQVAQEPYATFIRMRKIRDFLDGYNYYSYYRYLPEQYADTFCKQAEILKDLTDTFDEVHEFNAYIPILKDMSNDQLRTYLTWRTKYKSGSIVPIPHNYIILYAFEIINGIEGRSSDEIIRQLSALLKAYGSNKKTARQISHLIQDYYICNEMNDSFSEFVLKYDMENFYPCVFYGTDKIKNPLSFYGNISSYKIVKSKFYTDENLEMLNQCFTECLKQVIDFFVKYNIDFRKTGIQKINGDKWRLFRDTVYKTPKIKEKKTVSLSEFEVYSHTRSGWTCKSSAMMDQAVSYLIGYMLKRMESGIREFCNFKYKLEADLETMLQKIAGSTQNQIDIYNIMRNPDFTDLIDKTVKSFCHKPVTVDVDFSKLDQIRSDSAEIQDKLVITDDTTAADSDVQKRTITAEKEKQQISIHSIQQSENEQADQWKIFFSRLTNEQKHILQIISDKQRVSAKHTQQTELAKYAQEHHLLLEVVLEQINEIALESIEDTILDTAGNPVYIYDDYAEHLYRKLME